jgi:hypothetical protein
LRRDKRKGNGDRAASVRGPDVTDRLRQEVVLKSPTSISVKIDPAPQDEDRYCEEKDNRALQLSTAQRTNRITFWGTIAGILTLFALYIGLYQNRETMQIDQRAWIGVQDVATPPVLTGGTVLNPVVTVVNTGKTPAFRVVEKAGWQIAKAGAEFDPEPYVKKSVPIQQGTITPNGKREFRATIGPIVQQRADELNSGTFILYLYGEFTYSDAFDKPHFTRFAMRMTKNQTWAFAPLGTYDDEK